MQAELSTYKKELEAELENILHFWLQKSVDNEQGGFYGQIDYANQVQAQAPKGSVLNSRILWSFAAAYRHTGNSTYLQKGDFVAINAAFELTITSDDNWKIFMIRTPVAPGYPTYIQHYS